MLGHLQARRGGVDEPFAWDSREYLRKLCIGKVILKRFQSFSNYCMDCIICCTLFCREDALSCRGVTVHVSCRRLHLE